MPLVLPRLDYCNAIIAVPTELFEIDNTRDTLDRVPISMRTDLKEVGSDVEMFEILPTD